MKILLLAPHPFYQERGTPIAVDLLLKALSQRGDEVDLLCFNEGEDRSYKNVTLQRITPWPGITGVKPGFSLKKLWLDLWFFKKLLTLLRQNRYDCVHAIEESGFMAMLLCPLFGIPWILDMDSLMTTQIIDKFRWLRPVKPLLRWIESLPIRFANAVVPVCDALACEVRRYRSDNIFVLKDISLLSHKPTATTTDLHAHYQVEPPIVMYIGNLEPYQGIDLLIDAFALLQQRKVQATLLILGGSDNDIAHYQALIKERGLNSMIRLLGRTPVDALQHYMQQADLLVSPRTQGVNTPMKLYSYLDSGTAVLATDLPTHTQVLSSDVAALTPADPKAMGEKIIHLLNHPAERMALAANAKNFISIHHSYSAFYRQLDQLYQQVEQIKEVNA